MPDGKETFLLEDDVIQSLEMEFRDQNDNILRLSDSKKLQKLIEEIL